MQNEDRCLLASDTRTPFFDLASSRTAARSLFRLRSGVEVVTLEDIAARLSPSALTLTAFLIWGLLTMETCWTVPKERVINPKQTNNKQFVPFSRHQEMLFSH